MCDSTSDLHMHAQNMYIHTPYAKNLNLSRAVVTMHAHAGHIHIKLCLPVQPPLVREASGLEAP